MRSGRPGVPLPSSLLNSSSGSLPFSNSSSPGASRPHSRSLTPSQVSLQRAGLSPTLTGPPWLSLGHSLLPEQNREPGNPGREDPPKQNPTERHLLLMNPCGLELCFPLFEAPCVAPCPPSLTHMQAPAGTALSCTPDPSSGKPVAKGSAVDGARP
uniref:Uncharacterized protein n=1 Tax=Pipistrellus kuhlii TaxID=59472 RepID=A0A7J7VMW0_PIPKU|nr:hypothetical protein mPipKuh1_008391 [Pipistrellus kuhlii]